MRLIFAIRTFVLFFYVGIILMSCGGGGGSDPEPELTEKEKVTQLLTAGSGKWNPAPLANWVVVEGVNVSDLFVGFTITFTATGYTTSGTSPVWPRTGTWHFKDDAAKIFVRDSDNKEITIEQVSESTLRLTLTWDQTTYQGGRAQSIAGKYDFMLTK